MRPTDINGINKAAGEYYHLLYNNVFGVRACSLRLTNVYGPRQLIKHNRQGFIGWFIRLAIEDGEIQIFGDGSQLRDFVYVDDAADAFLRAGRDRRVQRRGLQRRRRRSRSAIASWSTLLHRDGRHGPRTATSSGRPRRRRIDIGSFYSDSTQVPARRRLGAAGRPARGPAADDRLLPRAPDAVRRSAGPRGDACSDPVPPLTPGEDAAGRATRRSTASSTAAGSSSVRSSRRSSRSSPPPAAPPHAVGVGTGTDALALALRGARHRAGRRGDHRRRCRRPTPRWRS